jgi:Cu2+-containing amine oxidase
MMDVGKTERMLDHHLKMSKELKFNKYIEQIQSKELSEMIEKFHINETTVDSSGFQEFLNLLLGIEYLDKDEVLNCLEVVRLKKRFYDKKAFISMIENPNVEKLLKTVLKISFSAFANLYSNTDVSKIVNLVHHIISSILKHSEHLKHLPPDQRQEEWNRNVQEIIKNSEEEFFLFCHQLVVKDESNQKIFLRTVGWISAMMNILGDSTLDMNFIFERKDENEIQEEFEKQIKIILKV